MEKHKQRLFLWVAFLFWFSLFLYVPILPAYLDTMQASYSFMGIVLGSYGLMQVIVRLPLGILSDYLRIRRPFLTFGMIALLISSAGFALTEQLEWTLLFRALSGVTASTWVIFTVVYASYYQGKSAQAMSNLQLVTVTAQLCGMSLSALLVDQWGIKSPFWFSALLGAAGVLLTLFIRDEKEQGGTQTPMRLVDISIVVKEPLLLKASVLSIFAHMVLFATMFGFTPAYAQSLGGTERELTYLVLSFMIPHALAAFLSVRVLAVRLGEWRTLLVGFIGSGLFTFLIPFLERIEWLCLTQALNGFALGLTFPLLSAMSIQNVAHGQRATAMGFYQAVYAVGMFVGPLTAGVISNSLGLSSGFVLAAGISVLGAALTLVFQKTKKNLAQKA
ncbi:MFS transporter [Brevibacillus centrosporus]|uniref:MFS transporter n=1 Tax=Brevibacillus centrosporus TaxID=54910 RepID=UPI003D21D3A1